MTQENNKEQDNKKEEIEQQIAAQAEQTNIQPAQAEKQPDYKDLLLRERADFSNYKKRVDREINDAKEITKIKVMQSLLPLIDSFDQAMNAVNLSKATGDDNAALKKSNDALRKGFELLYGQFLTNLKQEGVKPIEALGKQFSTEQHEALMQGKSDKPAGTIIEEYQKGYTLGNAVLRYSKVKISSGKQAEEKENANNSQ